MEEKLELSAPWHIFHSQVKALFEQDPDVKVDEELDETEIGYAFGIYSTNAEKIQAIKKLVGTKVVFGSVPVDITYGENKDAEPIETVWEKAFTGNPLFCKVVKSDMPFYGNFSYAVFKREILDFYGDDLSDVNGNLHYIVADLVKDVTNNGGIFVCTEGK